jgi:spoIIIJ-associated protein
MEDKVKILQIVTEELLGLMAVSATCEVSYDEGAEVFNVTIKSNEATGLLIGKKGETLSSIESILGFILKSKVGEWFRVSVNIGDYKEKEEDYLKGLADSVAQRVTESKKPENIYNLKGWQRRVVHMYLAEKYPDLTSESTGEGEERCLVITNK